MHISISIKSKKNSYIFAVNFGVSLTKLNNLDKNRYVTIKRKGTKYSFEFHDSNVPGSVKTVVKSGSYIASFDSSVLHFKPEKEAVRKVEYNDGIVVTKDIMTSNTSLKQIKTSADKKKAGFSTDTAWATEFENKIKEEITNRIDRAMRVKYE